jgi:hypothetical protein
VDPKDLPDLPYAAPQTNRQHAHSKEGNLFRRLLRALSLGRGSRAPARTRGTLVRAGSRSTRPRVMSAYEAQTNQRTLELAMERRRARGSVLYERGERFHFRPSACPDLTILFRHWCRPDSALRRANGCSRHFCACSVFFRTYWTYRSCTSELRAGATRF